MMNDKFETVDFSFIYNMSHDIRTPMNAIMGYTQMAKKYIDEPDKAMDCLNKLEVSEEQLFKIINDAFDMVRIESGKVILDEEPANIIDCLNRLIDSIKDQADSKKLVLLTDIEDVDVADAVFDEMKVGKIAGNIISNAVRFAPEGGKVGITVRQVANDSSDDGFICYDLIVTDNGIGMSKEFLDNHLFETFSRRHSTTISGVQGVGLGMSIAKRLIEMMDGEIEVESKPYEGTKVTCHFKFGKVNYSHLDDNESDDFVTLMGKRILLVEDNDLNREIAKDTLEDEGIIVEEATNGEEALKHIVNSKPGDFLCILMDVSMPVMDGLEATAKIRSLANKSLANIPIIAMTANAFDEDKERCLKAGMNAYLAKPIRNDKLFETINTLL
ncbi:MAG: response regulator [Lachnospiraceae bacterium]|nr:response regulator [Lachnospiraceae bacterium]